MINDKNTIISDFRKIGIQEGDFLFLTADLLKVGYFNDSVLQTENDWIEILQEVVGENGDVIAPCYSSSFFRFKKNKNLVFNKNSTTTSGALSKILLESTKSFRSTHPTNSYVGFGRRAIKILEQHDEEKSAYQVFEDIIAHKAKHLMIGTIVKGHAPLPFHQVLYSIGHNNKHPLSGLQQVYYLKNGKKEIFTRYDIGGCSDGGMKLFPDTINLSNSHIGQIGRAKTLVIDVAQAHKKIFEILSKDPAIALCNNRACFDCYGRINNPLFFITYLLNLPKIIRALIGNK